MRQSRGTAEATDPLVMAQQGTVAAVAAAAENTSVAHESDDLARTFESTAFENAASLRIDGWVAAPSVLGRLI